MTSIVLHALQPRLVHGRAALLAAGDFTDPKNARLVYLAAGGLALLGLLMVFATVAWWRNSRAEHPALAPLEVMSGRRFSKSIDGEQRRLLDAVRPEGAKPLPVPQPVPVDLSASNVESVTFDDLRDAHAEQLAALAAATKGLHKPAEPLLPDFDALLDAHLEPAPAATESPAVASPEHADPALDDFASAASAAVVDDETDLVARPIDPLLQRLESSEP